MVLVTQDELRSVMVLDCANKGVFPVDRYIEAMYTSLFDSIYFDRRTARWQGQANLERIFAHEYAHRLEYVYFRQIAEIVQRRNQRLDRPALGPSSEENPLEYLAEAAKKFNDRNNTQDRRRAVEFRTFLSEGYAEAVSIYLTGRVDGDAYWLGYMSQHRGIVLGSDQEFIESLEKALHAALVERLFSHGLRSVTRDLPQIFSRARKKFDHKYTKKLVAPK